MGKKQQPSSDTTSDPKKRRRIGFSPLDTGIEANECIKIYLVSSKEEVGTSNGHCINPVDLNSFFDEDGKIYGYQELKINVWVSSISFSAYADISFQSTSDGGKGITDLKSALQRVFGETLVESKDDFLQTFTTESHFLSSVISEGEKLQNGAPNGHSIALNTNVGAVASDVEIVRLGIGSLAAGNLYSRIVPLVLLLIDGSNPIDVTDPSWDLYVLTQKKVVQEDDTQHMLLGFMAVYRFYHYPDSSRLRLGQILVLPPYQHKGYGSYFVKVLSDIAICENVYDWTVEEPLDYFQHVRTCVDIKRLLTFEPVQDAIKSAVTRLQQGKLSKKTQVPRFMPPASTVESTRNALKINKKQFLQCWEILIYLGLDSVDKYMEDFTTIVLNRVTADILGKDSESTGKQVIALPSPHGDETSFVMLRSPYGEVSEGQLDEEQAKAQAQQLQQLVEERLKEIKLIAQKVAPSQCLTLTIAG